MTAVAGLLCLTTWAFMAQLASRHPRVLHFAPALLVLLLYGRYVHALASSVALLTAMSFACLYVRMPFEGTAQRLAVFLVLSAVVYYAAGGALFVYAVLCGVFEIEPRSRCLAGALCFVAAAVVPAIVGVFVLGLRVSGVYLQLLPYSRGAKAWETAFALCLCLCVPVMAGSTAVLSRLRKRGHAPAGSGEARLVSKLGEGPGLAGLKGRASSFALPVAAAALVWFSFNTSAARYLRLQYLARAQAWADILKTVRDVPIDRHDLLTNGILNRALYHEGRLLDEMFRYPQAERGLLPSGDEMKHAIIQSPTALMWLSDIGLDLGRVNESEHWAQEAFEYLGPRPWVLERLALVEIAKRREEVASLFLRVLKGDLMYGKWAAKCLSGPGSLAAAADHRVQRLRTLMVQTDTAGWLSPETLLLQLLESNKQNQMAFEYLMAYCLLTKQLNGVVENIGRLKDFGYSRIPRHCEEALLIYMAKTGKRLDLGGLSIGEPAVAEFAAFRRIVEEDKSDGTAALQAAVRQHQNTYFFYYVFVPLEETG